MANGPLSNFSDVPQGAIAVRGGQDYSDLPPGATLASAKLGLMSRILGDIPMGGGYRLPNPLGVATGAIGGALKGMASLPSTLYGLANAPDITGALGQAVSSAPQRFMDFLKTAGPTEMASAFAEPLAGAALTGGASAGGRALLRQGITRAPGAAVATNQVAAGQMPGLADIIRPSSAPPVSTLYQGAEAAPGYAETAVPLQNAAGRAGKVVEQYGRRLPGLPQGAVVKTSEALQGMTGMPLPDVMENIKGINEAIGGARAAGGENLGAWRSLLGGMHQDFRTAAAANPDNPALREAAEAVRQANLEFLANDFRDLTNKVGISKRPSDQMLKAQPGKMLETLRKDTQFRQDLERAAPGALAQIEQRLNDLVPLTDVALPPVRGVNVGSGRRVVGAAVGGLAGGMKGAELGALAEPFMSRLLMTRPGMGAVRWGLTPTPPPSAATMGAGAMASPIDKILRGP